ncbi:hypothetical protein V6U89_18785 [Micromonospora sp. CPCC 206171]|uniref:hypothetical protein n=1 Tax=Micromonospora sp. CPCC 206171 TaxID=3122405 RepID=UPI002FF3E323
MTGALTISLLTVASPAQAASWTSIYGVSATGWMGQDSPTVSTDRQGDALLVWAACDLNSTYCLHQVQARIVPANGSMDSIKTLSPLGSSSSWPDAASDDDGDSAVVWEQDGLVVGRRVSATGSLGTLQTIATWSAINPSVAVEPTGRALVTWTETRDGAYTTKARYFNTDSSLGPELTLGSGSGEKPAVAIDREGSALVVWTEGYQRVVATRVQQDSVSSPRTIASPVTGVGYGRVSANLDRDGDAVISYRRSHTSELPRVRVRLYSRAGTLSDVIYATPSTHDVTFYSALATDLDGDSVLVWSRRTSSTTTEVYGRRISRSGTLGTITNLGVGDRPAVTVDDDGNGLAAWHSPGPPYAAKEVHARTVARDGVFGAAERLSTNGRVVRVDSSPTGRFSVIWQRASHPYDIRARFGQ